MTCARAQEFLGQNKVEAQTVVDARKSRLGDKQALELASKADQLYAMKGTKVVYFDLKKNRPDDATILQCMIGPTGNLRAPTMLFGKTLLVGFDQATYKKVFSSSEIGAVRARVHVQ